MGNTWSSWYDLTGPQLAIYRYHVAILVRKSTGNRRTSSSSSCDLRVVSMERSRRGLLMLGACAHATWGPQKTADFGHNHESASVRPIPAWRRDPHSAQTLTFLHPVEMSGFEIALRSRPVGARGSRGCYTYVRATDGGNNDGSAHH